MNVPSSAHQMIRERTERVQEAGRAEPAIILREYSPSVAETTCTYSLREDHYVKLGFTSARWRCCELLETDRLGLHAFT